jgi:hypothetical protein
MNMAGELSPRDLRWLAGNGESEIVEPKRLFPGCEIGETPYLRRRLQDMSRLSEGTRPSAPPSDGRELSRRQALRVAAAALATGSVMTTRQARAAFDYASVTGPLTLAPPDLTGATTTLLSDRSPIINLGPGNQILVAPNVRLLNQFEFQGNGNATNMALIGGQFNPPIQFNPSTMLNLEGSDYALYTSTGLVGTTGGTFTIQCMESTLIYGVPPTVTAPIPWNATPSQIKDAINLALGNQNACFAVVQDPSQPAGAYKHVPGYNPSMGRVIYQLDGLMGSPTIPQRLPVYTATLSGPRLVGWTGIFHIEGVLVDGESFSDCWDIQNAYGTASLQYALLHNSTHYCPFHEDWVHPDGTQFYNGMAKFFVERSDFSSLGGNGLIVAPANNSSPFKLQAIYDYWMKDVYLRAYDPDAGRSPQLWVSAFFQAINEISPDWTVACSNVWTNKYAQSTGYPIPYGAQYTSEPDYPYWNNMGNYPPVIPDGVTVRVNPPGNLFCPPWTIGLGYHNIVGYTGAAQPAVMQRTVL